MAKDNNIAGQLQDLLVTRGFESNMLGANGQPVNDPEETKIFSFDYRSESGKNYGTMVIVLGQENDMQIMYGDNLGRAMEDPEDREGFFDFQHHLRDFAHRRRWTVTPTDISRLKHVQSGLAAIKEGLFEGYYGTRQVSYQGQATEARLMIRHSRPLRETDARHRHVESLFIETADGERFKLPFVNLMAGRAMLEHVRQGGRPYDIRGTHITEMVTELKVLSRFRRAAQNRVNESVTQELVEQVNTYYASLRNNLQHLSTNRGYQAYFETWHPAQIQPQEALVENIKSLFVEQRIDDRIEAALPLLAKIQQGSPMKEIEIFENWIANLGEGTWALPETPEDIDKLKTLLSQELIVGADAINATEQLYDLVGDDELFDRLGEIAQKNPNADVREVVLDRLKELGVDLGDLGQPSMGEDSAVFEGRMLDESGETLNHILDRFKNEVKRFEQGDDLDDDLYDALFDYYANSGEMPYGTMKGRTGDPFEWITQRLDQELGTGNFAPRAATPGVLPESSCNQTMEGEYCPQHGLAECGSSMYEMGTVAGAVAPMEDSINPMDHRGAVTDSFYESELDRLKKLALAK